MNSWNPDDITNDLFTALPNRGYHPKVIHNEEFQMTAREYYSFTFCTVGQEGMQSLNM